MTVQKIGVLLLLCGLGSNLPQANASYALETKPRAPVPTPTPHPMLVELNKRLSPVVRAADPDVVVELQGTSLAFRRITKSSAGLENMYRVHDILTPTVEDTAPTENGISLELSIQKVEYIQTPKTVRWPLWSTYYDRYVIISPHARKKNTANADSKTNTVDPYCYVDTERAHWAYAAMRTLIWASGTNKVSTDFSGQKPIAREDFAIAVLYAVRTIAAQYNGLPGSLDTPQSNPTGQPPVTTQQRNDALAALSREFRDEIKWLGGPPDLVARNMSSPLPADGPLPLWMSLSYGPKADAKLIEQIKLTVAEFAAEKAAQQKSTELKKEN